MERRVRAPRVIRARSQSNSKTAGPKEPPRSSSSWDVRKINCRSIVSCKQGEFVTVDSHETGLSFEGRARKGEIQGTIFQGPLEIPVTLRRSNN